MQIWIDQIEWAAIQFEYNGHRKKQRKREGESKKNSARVLAVKNHSSP